MNIITGDTSYFPIIPAIPFEGIASQNPLAFRWYDAHVLEYSADVAYQKGQQKAITDYPKTKLMASSKQMFRRTANLFSHRRYWNLAVTNSYFAEMTDAQVKMANPTFTTEYSNSRKTSSTDLSDYLIFIIK